MGARVDTTHNPLAASQGSYKRTLVEFFKWGGVQIKSKHFGVARGGGVGNVIVNLLFRPGAISSHTSCDTNLRHICDKFDNHLQLHVCYS